MKRILLLRHAKSDWDAPYGDDHDRPLAKRGRAASALVGQALTALGEVPDLVLTSSARRARDTVERAAKAGAWSCPVEVSRELYLSTPEAVLRILQGQDDAVTTLLLSGHEPTGSELAAELLGGGRLKLPTAALACIDVDVASWRELQPGRGVLVWLLTPKLLAKLRR